MFMSKNIRLIISLVAIFVLAVLVWYSPVLFKGYNSGTTDGHALVRARNLALAGKYSTESKTNVILAPELIPQEGIQSNYGNKLGTVLYSYLIRIFGALDPKTIVLINCIILALALIIFALAVNFLFDLKTSLIFSFFYIFFPSNWSLPQTLIGYNFALLFLSLFFLFFAIGLERFKGQGLSEKGKSHLVIKKFIIFGLAGLFLILACFCREVFFLLLPILFIYLLVRKDFRTYLIPLFSVVIIIFCIFWLPSFISGNNTYLLFFNNQADEALKASDFSYYSHIFPDPYTFHFNRESYLKDYYYNPKEVGQLDLLQQLGREKVLVNMGFSSVGLWDRIKIGLPLFFRHIFRLFSVTEIGGPFVSFLIILGLVSLKRAKSYWHSFFIFWFFSAAFLLAFINLANRNHLMDLGWGICLAMTVGFILLVESLSNNLYQGKYQKIISVLLLFLVVYNLVLASHVMWSYIYNDSPVPLIEAYASKIKEKNIQPDEVIAFSTGANDIYFLNYLTNKSMITFDSTTIEKLLKDNKLVDAFGAYKVKYILGYSPKLSSEIASNVTIDIIADSSIEIPKENKNITNKNWFLNLVK